MILRYFKGDRVEATGITDKTTYSFELVEYIFLEGNHKGKLFWQPKQEAKK